ncbi:hypothetical protein FKW77_000927 [Venturia effusa]|uniref:Uncharacterized protein n=1 Tax=Venturia effusa TaxID=50376 RepID=A0A517L8H8_9PEZI|nr:hypothetical protein FKW77_000927 [Venturia effusa]
MQAKQSGFQRSTGAFLAVPLRRQLGMKDLSPRTKVLTKTIWFVSALVAIWTVIVAGVGRRTGTCSAAYVRDTAHALNFIGIWQNYCQIIIRAWKDAYTERRDWLGLIVHSVIFGIICLGLHCAEVLTEMARDEAIWRRATTIGASLKLGSTKSTALSWQCWILFIFKCIVPWIFGYALDTTLSIIMNLLPILTIAALLLLLALLAEFLVCHRPRGSQPATFGNVEALVSLIDDWQDGKIFWGDKGAVTETIRKAGTSGQRLADLRMTFLYYGLRG